MWSYRLDTVSGPDLAGHLPFLLPFGVWDGLFRILLRDYRFLVTFALSNFPSGLLWTPDLPIYISL